jgi:hypothetical protein
MRWMKHVARMGDIKLHIVLVGKSEKKKIFRKCRHRSEYNIKISLREIGCENVAWIHLAQDKVQ